MSWYRCNTSTGVCSMCPDVYKCVDKTCTKCSPGGTDRHQDKDCTYENQEQCQANCTAPSPAPAPSPPSPPSPAPSPSPPTPSPSPPAPSPAQSKSWYKCTGASCQSRQSPTQPQGFSEGTCSPDPCKNSERTKSISFPVLAYLIIALDIVLFIVIILVFRHEI